MNIIRLTLLLVITLLARLTVFSQTTSSDSLKCFTYAQVRLITSDLQKKVICDSVVVFQDIQIKGFKDVLTLDEQIIAKNNKRLLELTKTLNKTNKKLKFSANLSKFGIPFSIGGGFIIGFLLAK